MKPKALVLFSGGFDSVVTLHEVMRRGYEPELFFIDYGQRNKQQELSCAEYWKDKYKLQLGILKLNSFSWSDSKLYKMNEIGEYDKSDDKVQYIEMRNLIFLSYAVSYAQSQGILDIFAGIIDGQYEDSNMHFVKLFDTLIYSTTGIQLIAPFGFMNKYELKDYAIKTLGLDLKEVLEHSISCNLVDVFGNPCGKCLDCKVIEEFHKEI